MKKLIALNVKMFDITQIYSLWNNLQKILIPPNFRVLKLQGNRDFLNSEQYLWLRKTGLVDNSPDQHVFCLVVSGRTTRTTLIYCLYENRLKSIHGMTRTLIRPGCFPLTILLCGINNIIMIEGQYRQRGPILQWTPFGFPL